MFNEQTRLEIYFKVFAREYFHNHKIHIKKQFFKQ